MILNLALLFVFLGVLAFSMRDGLWTNTIRFFNVIFAATIASAFGEPMACVLSGMHGSSFFFHSFIGTWIVFCFACVLLNEIAKRISRIKVRFEPRVNMIGGYVVAALTGMVFVCFTLFTMHQAPLAKNFMQGNFDADSRMCFGMAPDRQWHDYFWYVSQGAYSAGEKRVFDKKGNYAKNYEKYRETVEKYAKNNGTLGVAPDSGFKR